MARTGRALAGCFCLTVALGWCGATARAAIIDFDGLAEGEIVTNQFPELTFTGNSFPVTVQDAGDYFSGHSRPNTVFSGPDALDPSGGFTIDFTSPVNDLSFVVLGDNDPGTPATIEIFHREGSTTAGLTLDGNVFNADLVDLAAFSDVTSIIISDNSDPFGLGFDDFTFTPIPEPTTALLLACGLVGLASRGKMGPGCRSEHREALRRALDPV